jgi:hypothetical protein
MRLQISIRFDRFALFDVQNNHAEVASPRGYLCASSPVSRKSGIKEYE